MQSLSLQGYYSQRVGMMGEVMRGNKRARGVVGNVMYGNKYMVKWMAQRSGLTMSDLIHAGDAPAPAPAPEPPVGLLVEVTTVFEAELPSDAGLVDQTGLVISWTGDASSTYQVTATVWVMNNGVETLEVAFDQTVTNALSTVWPTPGIEWAYTVRVRNVTSGYEYAPIDIYLPYIGVPTSVELEQEQTDDVTGVSRVRLLWSAPANAQPLDGSSVTAAYMTGYEVTGIDGTVQQVGPDVQQTEWADVTSADVDPTIVLVAVGTSGTKSIPPTTLAPVVPASAPVTLDAVFSATDATVTFLNPASAPTPSGLFEIFVVAAGASNPVEPEGSTTLPYDPLSPGYTAVIPAALNGDYTAYVRLVSSDTTSTILDQGTPVNYINGVYASITGSTA